MKPNQILTKLSLAIAVTAVIAGCTSRPWDIPARQDQNIDSVNQTKASYDTWGRRWGVTPATETAVAPAAPAAEPAAAPAAAPVPTSCSSVIKTGLINLSKTAPAEATLGQEYLTEINAKAVACAGNVVITDRLPAGASFVRSEPAAKVDGSTLTWNLGDMDAGQAQNIKVWLKADQEGTLVNCALVAADPRVCAATFVGKAALAIAKSGPATATLGSDVTYNITVKNTGNTVARNVVVTDPVPAGLSGQPATVAVGNLAPGQAKTLAVTFKADKRGKACNTATANSDNAGKVSAEACTVVQQPGLKIEKSGTKSQIIGRNADYEVVVFNTGDTALENVVVTDTAPEGTVIAAAPEATVKGNKATWTIPSLAAGAKQAFAVKLTGKTGGEHCNAATATAGGMSDSAQSCTTWKGVAAVLLEVVDDPDPLQAGEVTTYTITVKNQGFADIHNVKIASSFAAEVVPVSSEQGSVSGQDVSFPSVPVLAAKQSVVYTIKVKAVAAGDSRNKTVLTCDELKTPVTEEESTTVY
ncbi:MAG: OmcB family cysteine-rich outer membrane protein [Verrucomicrobia bacterium]|nr:OmcB family cysteine-rich outer membrane protein [Verrucomicrobiota bacterium]